MKVFISWSGEFSKKIALQVKDWIEQCIQSVEAFVSNEDIEKGENWTARLSNELTNTNYGIVCLTSDNISAPWIHFEAGALSKMVDSRVSTLAVDIQYAEIKGPLSGFQNTKIEKDDMFNLLKSINTSMEKCGDKSLTEEKLKTSFNAFWNSFEVKIKELFEEHKKEPVKKVSNKLQIQQETIDELLQLVRNQNAILSDPSRLLPQDYLELIFSEGKTDNRNERLFSIVNHYIRRMIMLIETIDMNKEPFLYREWTRELERFMDDMASLNKEWGMRILSYKEHLFRL